MTMTVAGILVGGSVLLVAAPPTEHWWLYDAQDNTCLDAKEAARSTRSPMISSPLVMQEATRGTSAFRDIHVSRGEDGKVVAVMITLDPWGNGHNRFFTWFREEGACRFYASVKEKDGSAATAEELK